MNNTLKTNGEYCIDAIELKEGTIIKNNNLIANHTKGDASIKNNEKKQTFNIVRSSTNATGRSECKSRHTASC